MTRFLLNTIAKGKKYTNVSRADFKFLVGIVFTIIYIICINFLRISIPYAVYVVVLLPIILMLSYEQYIMLLFFFIPISSAIPYHMVYPFILVLLLYKRKARLSSGQLFLPLVIILHEAFLWVTGPEIPPTMHMVSYCIILLFIFILSKDDFKIIDYFKCINMYIIGTVVLCFVVISDSIVSGTFISILSGLSRLGSSSHIAYVNNLNNYAYYIVVAISCVSVSVIQDMSNRNRYSGKMLLLMFLALSGWFMSSRAFTITLLLIIIMAIFYLSFSGSIKKRHLLLCLGILVIVVLIGINNPQFFSIIINRFETGNNTQNTRSAIFNFYLNWFRNSGWRKYLGAGALTYKTVVLGSRYDPYSLHNGLEQILISYGYIGFIYVICAFISCVKSCKGKRRIPFIYFIPLITVCVFVQTIQFLNPYELMMPFLVSCYCIRSASYNTNSVNLS